MFHAQVVACLSQKGSELICANGGEIIVNDGKAKPAVLCWHSLSASGSRRELGDKRNLVLELGKAFPWHRPTQVAFGLAGRLVRAGVTTNPRHVERTG